MVLYCFKKYVKLEICESEDGVQNYKIPLADSVTFNFVMIISLLKELVYF